MGIRVESRMRSKNPNMEEVFNRYRDPNGILTEERIISSEADYNCGRFLRTSSDNGKTWSAPVDISEGIYAQFDNGKYGPARSMFIASGKVTQSRYVKAGKYYRLYCAVLQTIANGDWANFVLYSDDFGGSWKVLGAIRARYSS